jgi:hypothetical protein
MSSDMSDHVQLQAPKGNYHSYDNPYRDLWVGNHRCSTWGMIPTQGIHRSRFAGAS